MKQHQLIHYLQLLVEGEDISCITSWRRATATEDSKNRLKKLKREKPKRRQHLQNLPLPKRSCCSNNASFGYHDRGNWQHGKKVGDKIAEERHLS
jgi:hypothetical protein